MLSLHFNFQEAHHVELMTNYRLYKLKHLPTNVPPMVNRAKDLLAILPVSSAECERGSSAMNRQHTKDRNRLQSATIR